MDRENLPVVISSRMQYVPEDKKPIAGFVIDFTRVFNNDGYTHYIVPLFRVLDALINDGRPYSGA